MDHEIQETREIENYKLRLHRLMRCRRKPSHNILRVHNTGLVPAGMYGDAVHGISDKELHGLKLGAASSVGAAKGSIARAAALCDHSSWRPAVAPVIRWAEEVWLAVSTPLQAQVRNMPLSELSAAWGVVANDPPSCWGGC